MPSIKKDMYLLKWCQLMYAYQYAANNIREYKLLVQSQ